MFKTIISFFRATNRFFVKTADVLDQVTKELDRSTDASIKNSMLKKEQISERRKKSVAKAVIDGGHESEEAMNISLQKFRENLRKRR